MEKENELTKKQVGIIFELAKCEVWKERMRNGECSLGEFMEAMELKNLVS